MSASAPAAHLLSQVSVLPQEQPCAGGQADGGQAGAPRPRGGGRVPSTLLSLQAPSSP